MLSRYEAADVGKFTEECEIAFAFDHTGEIVYAVSLNIDGERHGCSFANPGEKAYTEDTVAKGIAQLYEGLVTDGYIGHFNLKRKPTATLTGEPLKDLIQLAGTAVGAIQ